ncbi:tRNA (adenosine(37)-N6)-threonylcarbamoyltransferase complex dimerization subunit type 1 TsaB [Deinococcus petrolearius]|uniref:tRNA (Adenosine(37)-N6)-threonylcarbamoyltransferase complex dimerization subunit type 1 TsaB n=1 Tax=Deinococcus petrolearius TaxID=1751295 RepID=A0ABW1DGV5_9DEIO
MTAPAAPRPAPDPLAPAVTLALDTATPHLTLALRWGGGVAGPAAEWPVLEWREEVGRAHAERVAGALDELFGRAGLPRRADAVVIGTGPGSYTGVRVGASYALGLARVWGAPVLGVPTLEALVRGDGPQAVALDARKGNVYGAVYDVTAGVVTAVRHAPRKVALEDFRALAPGLPLHLDPVPSGPALLCAGLDHGVRDWALAYL